MRTASAPVSAFAPEPRFRRSLRRNNRASLSQRRSPPLRQRLSWHMAHGMTRHHIYVEMVHHPKRTGQRDSDYDEGEDERHHRPAVLGTSAHVQEKDHVDHD